MRMTMLASVVASSLAVSALASVAACGKKDDAPAPTPSVTPSTGPLAPTTRPAEPPLSPADSPACKLITQDEAAKIMGHPVKPAEARSGAGVPICRFKADGSPGSVSLQYFERGADNFDSVRNVMIKDGVEIAGAGTKAVRNPDGSLIAVLANGHMAMIAVIALGKNNGPTAAAADEFARTVAGRL